MERKILIVDDDEAIRGVVSDFLTAEGYEVLEAPDGARGIEMARERRPTLVLLDMVMPDMSGIDALAILKKECPEMMVLMMSGVQEDATAKEAIRLGAYDYITKPVSLDKLKTEFIDRIFS